MTTCMSHVRSCPLLCPLLIFKSDNCQQSKEKQDGNTSPSTANNSTASDLSNASTPYIERIVTQQEDAESGRIAQGMKLLLFACNCVLVLPEQHVRLRFVSSFLSLPSQSALMTDVYPSNPATNVSSHHHLHGLSIHCL